jgi:hypothetical protein
MLYRLGVRDQKSKTRATLHSHTHTQDIDADQIREDVTIHITNSARASDSDAMQ